LAAGESALSAIALMVARMCCAAMRDCEARSTMKPYSRSGSDVSASEHVPQRPDAKRRDPRFAHGDSSTRETRLLRTHGYLAKSLGPRVEATDDDEGQESHNKDSHDDFEIRRALGHVRPPVFLVALRSQTAQAPPWFLGCEARKSAAPKFIVCCSSWLNCGEAPALLPALAIVGRTV